MNTDKKVVVITGASRGIGAALVEAYRARDFRVVAISRSIKPSQDVDILTVAGDVADRNTSVRAISEGMAKFGRIDSLINNAGIFISKPFTMYTQEDYAAILSVNVTGFFHITQLAIAAMETRGSGHVVQITSSIDETSDARVPAVLAALTKGGLNAATKSLAIEYARRGIRVNAVAPAATKTEMHPPETHKRLGESLPLGRMAEISDVVEAILYLESAGFVTGEILHVDGGQSAGH
jgi:NAD(P)-dependent dehydrogenase (short-subunit alcohol dehydrogenase family)